MVSPIMIDSNLNTVVFLDIKFNLYLNRCKHHRKSKEKLCFINT